MSNQITVAGALGLRKGTSLELRHGQSGKAYMQFRLADNWTSNGEKTTVWWTVKVWGDLAQDLKALNPQAGDLLIVTGRVMPNEWIDQDGNERNEIALHAFDIGKNVRFLAREGRQEGDEPQRMQSSSAFHQMSGGAPQDHPDEEPFSKVADVGDLGGFDDPKVRF
ncbi:MAG: single-stranded DNA-binding protein [Gammaproteobacteria bacterium]|nr:single-stranded DNA-binding protein [Gammaproteobacteria bacterium]